MSEENFWALIWSIIAITLVALVALGVQYSTEKDKLAADLAKAGINPVAIPCILDRGTESYCMTVAIKEQK